MAANRGAPPGAQPSAVTRYVGEHPVGLFADRTRRGGSRASNPQIAPGAAGRATGGRESGRPAGRAAVSRDRVCRRAPGGAVRGQDPSRRQPRTGPSRHQPWTGPSRQQPWTGPSRQQPRTGPVAATAADRTRRGNSRGQDRRASSSEALSAVVYRAMVTDSMVIGFSGRSPGLLVAVAPIFSTTSCPSVTSPKML